MKARQEPGFPPMTFAQQTVLVGMVSGVLTGVATVVSTEVAPPDERPALRRERYLALAGAAVVGGTLGALLLAINAHDDGYRGNVG